MQRRIALHYKIVIALVLGVAVGLVLNQTWTAETWRSLSVGAPQAFFDGKADPANEQATFLAHAVVFVAKAARFIGDLFLGLLKFAAVPLVLFALITAAANMGDLRTLGRLGVRTIALFLCTLACAVTIGILAANVGRPGTFVSQEARNALTAGVKGPSAAAAADHDLWSILNTAIPSNLFDALSKGAMSQIVVGALLIGACLTLMPRERAAPVTTLCESLFEVFLRIVAVVMRLAPAAVFCLIAATTARMGLDVIRALSAFCLVVVIALFAQVALVYWPIVVFLGRMALSKFIRGMAEVQLVAFSTSSSAATLPVTIRCVEHNLGVPKNVVSFVCAAGTTINMDGTAMYQTMVALFIAQMYGIDLSLGQQIMIAAMAAFASVGAPGIPSGGIVLLVGVLQAAKLPVEGIAVILGVDRLLDMCRTVVNVTGDAVGAVVVARWESRRASLPPPQPTAA